MFIIGRADRLQCGKQIASYLGLVPLEDSSGNRRRLGHITKQGSSMLRILMVEASQVTVRSFPEWSSKYFHLMMRRGRKIAELFGWGSAALVPPSTGARFGSPAPPPPTARAGCGSSEAPRSTLTTSCAKTKSSTSALPPLCCDMDHRSESALRKGFSECR